VTGDILHLTEAMIVEPGNDSIRLALAEAYEEAGSPLRADFIRVQLQLAVLDPYHLSCTGGKCKTCGPLRTREDELRLAADAASVAADWFPGWFGMDSSFLTTRMYTFLMTPSALVSRGFVSDVRCSWDVFSSHHRDWFWHPDQTVACDNCDGFGEFTRELGSDPPYGPCPNCGGQFHSGPFLEPLEQGWDPGTGQVPRQPTVGADPRPTFQPLERVIITHLYDSHVFNDLVIPGPSPSRRALALSNSLGHIHNFTMQTCLNCNGLRRVDSDMEMGDIMIPTVECWACQGRGYDWVSASWPGVRFYLDGR